MIDEKWNKKWKDVAEKVKDTVSSIAHSVGDLNGDGKIDGEDVKIAAEWAKKSAVSAGTEARRIGKEALDSDMVKDAAAGAAVGAAIAIPVPVIGPLAGAAIGAGLGVYKNIVKKDAVAQKSKEISEGKVDVQAELLKFHDLKQKGIITDEEFEVQKNKLLK